jgi:3-phenylpropionate/cinnamic acid dioxygenase small subunit
VSASAELRNELEELYADYVAVVDSGALERWPQFFVEPCLYRIVSKENHDKALPLSLMRCEGLGMLNDRAFASQKLNVYGPRVWRHMVSQIRVSQTPVTPPSGSGDEPGRIAVQANFVVFETLHDQCTRVLVGGRYLDTVVRTGAGLRFREKVCVYDSAIIPGSIVAPI